MENKVVVSLEFRFLMTPDGMIWTDSIYDNEFWQRYLDIFDEVYIVARVKKVDKSQQTWKSVGNSKIKFLPLTYYVGPIQIIKKVFDLNRELTKISDLPYHFILRVPSFIGILLYRKLLKRDKKFGLEVVGDPDDVFQVDTLKVKFVDFYRWLFVRELRMQCSSASAVSYVTANTLQKKYPANKDVFTTNYSSIELPDYFYSEPFRDFSQQKLLELLFIGSLAQKYKGLDILLKALAHSILNTADLKLTIVGDGMYKNEYEILSLELGIADKVSFQGYIADKKEIHKYYMSSDIFVLPSLTEGLPRVVIEAMSTSLPVIATNVGGIPELLNSTSMVDSGNVDQLAVKIEQFINDNELLYKEAKRNYIESKNYKYDLLQDRRKEFFRKIIS